MEPLLPWIYTARSEARTRAQRLDRIRHTRGATLLLEPDYGYSPDGLVTSIVQTDSGGGQTVNYGYDKRGRLIREWGTLKVGGGTGISTAVDLAYTYDQVGNRLMKTDASVSPSKVTTYYYDVHDSNWETVYGTFNNRLMKCETAQGETLLEQTWYAYNAGGQVKRIVRRWPNSPPAGKSSSTYYILRLQYNIDQQLWLLKQMECPVGGPCTPETGTTTRIREFRYDGDGRRRYLVRERDPEDFTPVPGSNSWREYHGSNIYAELEVNESTGAAEATRRYLHGVGLAGWQDTATGQWHFVLPDMLGSTRLVTDGSGDVASGMSYTAFGEIAGQTNPGGASARSRYGYCGAWGYENDGLPNSADEFGLLHLGARYYDPGLGRFSARDGLGIFGGINTYTYVGNCPPTYVDATGREGSYVGVAVTAGIGALLGGITNGASVDGWSWARAGAGAAGGAVAGLAGSFLGPVAGTGIGNVVTGFLEGDRYSELLVDAIAGAVSGWIGGMFLKLDSKFLEGFWAADADALFNACEGLVDWVLY